MEVDSGTDALGIEKKMEENKRLICETVSKDKDGEEVPDQEEEVTSLKTLTAGHHALQFKLQHATLELALKENRYKDCKYNAISMDRHLFCLLNIIKYNNHVIGTL